MVFLIMGSVLAGYMFRYQFCVVGGVEAIVFGSIQRCVGRFDLAALCGCRTLNVCYVMLCHALSVPSKWLVLVVSTSELRQY